MKIYTNTRGDTVGKCEHMGIQLDLGCGMRRHRDTLGIDLDATDQTDIVRDFETQGLPFCDDSVENIIAHNILEHLGDGFHFLMMECWRVLKQGGVLDIEVPGAFSEPAMRDPTHKRHFTRSTWGYFQETRPKYHSYMEDYPWIILDLEGEDDGLIKVKMTPNKNLQESKTKNV